MRVNALCCKSYNVPSNKSRNVPDNACSFKNLQIKVLRIVKFYEIKSLNKAELFVLHRHFFKL